MTPYIQLALASGHVFELPTSVIVADRANYYFKQCPDEFKTFAEAEADTEALFDDSLEAKDWLLNNMNPDEVLKKHGRLVAFHPPAFEWDTAEVTPHDKRADVQPLSGEGVMAMPVGIVATTMAASGELCGAQQIMDPETGQPMSALVFITGGPGVVGFYLHGLQIITEQVLSQMEAANAAAKQQH